MTGVILDTGFLVALFRPDERLREAARGFLRNHRHGLLTVAPVIVETCFFLSADGKLRLLEWIERGAVAVADVPTSAYAQMRALIRKYADRNLDFADLCIVWLAETSGCRAILTVDERDFSAVRLAKGKRFDLIDWFG